MYGVVSVTPSSQQAYFYIEDETLGTATSITVSYSGSYGWDGSTAAWIVERPENANNQYMPLTDYGTTAFSSIFAMDQNGNTIDLSQSNDAVTMTDDTLVSDNGGDEGGLAQALSVPSSPNTSNDGFGTTWQAYGDFDTAP
jgi:hypothetical protein